MYKKSASVATIATKSLGIYFEKLPMFLKYLAVPVLLQILGGVVIGGGMIFIALKNVLLAVILLITGIVILINAIWKYLIKMGGLVLISRQIIENEPLKDTKYYTQAFENRGGYVTYLLITGLIIPLLLIMVALICVTFVNMTNTNSGLIFAMLIVISITVILSPFLIVTFQSFALSPNLTPWESIVKGMKLSGKKYVQSWGISILYVMIASIVLALVTIFAKMISVGAGLPKGVADIIVQIFSQFFLPYWALCFTWWYLRIEKEERSGR